MLENEQTLSFYIHSQKVKRQGICASKMIESQVAVEMLLTEAHSRVSMLSIHPNTTPADFCD